MLSGTTVPKDRESESAKSGGHFPGCPLLGGDTLVGGQRRRRRRDRQPRSQDEEEKRDEAIVVSVTTRPSRAISLVDVQNRHGRRRRS